MPIYSSSVEAEFAVGAAEEDAGPEPAGWNAPSPNRPPALLNLKYIRHRRLGFILFEPSVTHDAMASAVGGSGEILSAGFVVGPGAELRCLGHSGTLNLGAGPTDTGDLRQRMRLD